MTWHKPKQVKGVSKEEVLTFPSLNKAALYFEGSTGNIWKALVGKRPSAHGYRWVYEERV